MPIVTNVRSLQPENESLKLIREAIEEINEILAEKFKKESEIELTEGKEKEENLAPLSFLTDQKYMLEVNSLGQNTVTLKDNQMIVSGPDFDEAQVIAKQLSSGASRLATLNGRQVLISFSSTMVNVNQQLQRQTAQKSQK